MKPRLPPMAPSEMQAAFAWQHTADYWRILGTTLVGLIEDIELQARLWTRTELIQFDREQLHRYWKMQLQFLAHHSTECLLALLYSIHKEGTYAWAALATYGTKEIEGFADSIQKEGLTFLQLKGRDPVLSLFYPYVDPNEDRDEPNFNQIEAMRKFIPEYLKGLAGLFQDDGAFNAHKHGNRVVVGRTEFTITPNDGPQAGKSFTFGPQDSMMYWLPERGSGDNPDRFVVRHDRIQYRRSVRILMVNCILIDTLMKGYKTIVTDAKSVELHSIDAEAADILADDPPDTGAGVNSFKFGLQLPPKEERKAYRRPEDAPSTPVEFANQSWFWAMEDSSRSP